MATDSLACPCGTTRVYAKCCEPYITGKKQPPTAEALMRARYTAYATVNIDYLKQSLHPDERHDFDEKNAREWAQNSEWTGLEIKSVEGGGKDDREGKVEFIAHYRIKDHDLKHHEIGVFLKENDTWYFTDGKMITGAPVVRTTPKIGRNDPCNCGSGKKYKKCCAAN